MNTFDSTSPKDAAEQLRTAQNIERRLTGPVPVLLVAYGLLCSIASSGVFLLHLAQDSRQHMIFVIALMLGWVAIAIIVPFLFRQPARRGLGTRWGYYIAAWAVLWGLGVAVSTADLPLVIVASALFLVVFLIAAILEARITKRARNEHRGHAPTSGEAS